MVTVTKAQLVNVKELAAMLNVSQRHVWRQKSAGKLPKPVNIGGCVRWLLSDIEAWLEMGCPSQRKFEQQKDLGRKRK